MEKENFPLFDVVEKRDDGKGKSEVFHSGTKNHPPKKLGAKVGKKCLIH